MKKLFLLGLLAFFTFGIISCNSEGFEEEREDVTSLTSMLNADSSNIDLSTISCIEDASINKSKKISNGNFGGKTLTVNTNDVVLENVDNIVIVISEVARGKITLINCSDVLVITIKGGEELSITDSSVKEINVNDDNSSINLVNDTNVEKINVSQKGTAINSETTGESEKAPVITELNVAPTVDNVDVSGGTIGNVVINEAGTESAPTVTVTGGITIEKVESKDETGATKPGNIVVSDNAKDDVVLPEGVTPITIKSISLGKGEGVKYSYEVGDVFDYTDLVVVITYSDDSKKSVMLNKVNSVVMGFDSSAVGTCTLSFKYNDIAVEGTINITVSETSKEWKVLLNQGIELICEGHFDEGFAKIKLAYANEQNDETKMYYALVELASISTDESVNKIMKENLGITNYPAEFNSLISGDWLESYPTSRWVDLYDVYDAKDYYGYVRVDGELCESWEDNSVRISCYLDDEGDWLDPDYYNNYEAMYIKNPVVSEDGRYLVYKHYVSKIPEGTKYYEYDWTGDYKKILDYDDNSSLLAQFNEPAWLKDTDYYKESFVGATATITTQAYRFYASLIDCNPNGANELIDNIVNVFNTKFNPVKEIANTISNNSVLIPAKVIETLNLEELLGDSNVKLGKAELNVVIASLQLFKGIFEWISSYDLSANITELKSLFNSNESFDHNFINDIIKVDTFKTRNESAMALSKATFVDALDMLLASYDFIVSSENDYPQAAKDEIKRYGEVLKSACNQLKNSITNRTVFYIPKDNPFETSEWNATKDNCWFGIDMGELFKAGYFSNIVERTSSGVLKIMCDVEARTYEGGYDVATFEVTSDMSAESLEAKILQLGKEKHPEAYSWRGDLYINFNTELLDALLPGLGLNNHDGDGGKMQIYGVRIKNENE
ncbi:MAG: bacterial Ig-like domain-containing protein [Treponema sp.]|nr:bacterial Ig-like domain-containing protein [Treponema sp.]